MNKKNVLIAFVMTVFSFGLAAHEGQDHDKPSAIQAPKGGQIKSLEEAHVEVLTKGKNIKIYVYDKELKPRATKDFTISGLIQLPRNKKQEGITFAAVDQYFETSYDAKGMHRYTLILAVKDAKTGHDDKLKFIIEPKK